MRDLWLDLSEPPLAVSQRLAPDQRFAARAALDAQQTAVLTRVRALGGQELARVRVVRNAVAVSIPAARLADVASIEGVVRVSALQHRMHVLPAASAAARGTGR